MDNTLDPRAMEMMQRHQQNQGQQNREQQQHKEQPQRSKAMGMTTELANRVKGLEQSHDEYPFFNQAQNKVTFISNDELLRPKRAGRNLQDPGSVFWLFLEVTIKHPISAGKFLIITGFCAFTLFSALRIFIPRTYAVATGRQVAPMQTENMSMTDQVAVFASDVVVGKALVPVVSGTVQGVDAALVNLANASGSPVAVPATSAPIAPVTPYQTTTVSYEQP